MPRDAHGEPLPDGKRRQEDEALRMRAADLSVSRGSSAPAFL